MRDVSICAETACRRDSGEGALASCRDSARRRGYGDVVKPENIAVRPAARGRRDLAIVDAFIRKLAKEECLPDATASLYDLDDALFGASAIAHALIVEVDSGPAGFALYYPKYSTVIGRRGLHLEDIYVAPRYRDRRIGRVIVEHLQALSGPRGMVDLWVMHSNESAIGFHQRVGARELDGIAVYRLDHPDLDPSSGLTGLSSSETIGQ